MKKEELLKKCRFFRDGGESEAEQAYKKGGLSVVCWLGESLWVSNGGNVSKDQEDLRDLVSSLSPDLSLALRCSLADAFDHFNKGLLYENRGAFVRSLREDVFPFYKASQAIS